MKRISHPSRKIHLPPIILHFLSLSMQKSRIATTTINATLDKDRMTDPFTGSIIHERK